MAEHPATEGEKGDKKEAAPKAPLNTTNLLLMVVLGVLALLIVGGVIGGILLYRSTSNHTPAAQAQNGDAVPAAEGADKDKGDKAKEGEKKKDSEKKKDDKPKGPAIYVTLEPPFVVNFKAGKPAKFLQVSMEIMTRAPEAAQILKENNPLLRNDLLMLFGGQEYDDVATPDGREALRAHALDTARGVVKKEGGKPTDIEAVYFTSLVMQ